MRTDRLEILDKGPGVENGVEKGWRSRTDLLEIFYKGPEVKNRLT